MAIWIEARIVDCISVNASAPFIAYTIDGPHRFLFVCIAPQLASIAQRREYLGRDLYREASANCLSSNLKLNYIIQFTAAKSEKEEAPCKGRAEVN